MSKSRITAGNLGASKNGKHPEPNLDGLVETITAAHRAGVGAVRKGLEHYHAAGQALIQAKQLCGHGNWLTWLKESCPEISEKRAQRYMRLAESDVTSDLEGQWEVICGNAPATAEAEAEKTDPEPLEEKTSLETDASETEPEAETAPQADPKDEASDIPVGDDDGSRETPFGIQTKAVADDLDEILKDLQDTWGTPDAFGTAVRALYYAHKRLCKSPLPSDKEVGRAAA